MANEQKDEKEEEEKKEGEEGVEEQRLLTEALAAAEAELAKVKAVPLYKLDSLVQTAVDDFLKLISIDGWASHVYRDYCIVRVYSPDTTYKVTYEVDGDDNVSIQAFVDWVQVKNEWIEIKEAEDGTEVGVSVAAGPPLKTYLKEGDGNIGIVEQLGIRFSEKSTDGDLVGDWFDSTTDFGYTLENNHVATLNHRMPMTRPGSSPDEVKFLQQAAVSTFKYPVKTRLDGDGLGIIARHALDLNDAYEKMIYDLTEAGVFTWSSGSTKHLVDKGENGFIKRWPVAEFAYTPCPAEPQLGAITPIKSLSNLSLPPADTTQETVKSTEEVLKTDTDGGSESDESSYNNQSNKQEKLPAQVKTNDFDAKGQNDMADENKDVTEQEGTKSDGGEATNTAQQDAKIDAMQKSIGQLTEMLKAMPASEKAGYVSDKGGTNDQEVKSFGDFITAVARRDNVRLATVYGSRQEHADATKALNEGNGAEGGFTVPSEYTPGLLKIDPMANPVLSRVKRIPVNSNSGSFPGLDQFFAPTPGSGQTAFAGGVKTDMTAEGATLPATEPAFNMLTWRVHKIGGHTQVTNELLADSPEAIEALLTSLFSVAINAEKERQILLGSGAGECKGIIDSTAIVNVAADTAGAFTWNDVAAMQAQFKPMAGGTPVWVIHPSMWTEIMTMELGTAGGAVWSASMQAAQGGKLNGYDIIVSEHLPQVGNRGGVMLADLSAYAMWERQQLMIAYSEHAGFLDDMGTWRFTSRCDGQPWLRKPVTLAGPGAAYEVSPFVVHGG